MSGVRINRFLASCGLGSRRACEGIVRTGRVVLNGRRVDSLGVRVGPGDQVLVDGEPVTMASINLMEGASRVDDVCTHVAHRGKGYCRTLIHALLAYYDALSTQPLYLWAENPTAIRIYQEAGFVEQRPDADSWYAWKDPSKQ